MLDINDFLAYANAGNVPTVYSKRKQAAPARVRAMPKVESFVSSFRSVPLVNAVATVAPVRVNVERPAPEAVKPALELVNYSERSFAIFGETRPMQAQLEALGGKFNRWLKRDGVSTAGYIFSISRIDYVKKSLNL